MIGENDLLKILKDHKPHDEKEKNYKDTAIKFLRRMNLNCNRNNFNPGHVTGSAFIVDDSLCNVLLIFHTKLHRWLQPGGHVEPSDISIAHTASRELMEETGMFVEAKKMTFFDIDVHKIPPQKNDPKHLHFDFRFVYVTNRFTANAGTDASKVEWVSLKELGNFDIDNGILRMAEKICTKEL